MSERTRYVLAGMLVATILVAGCLGSDDDPAPVNNTTQQVSPTMDDGVTTSFSSVSSVYTEGEPIVLELDLENTGERRATNIRHRLYGASFVARQDPAFAGKDSLRGVHVGQNQEGESTQVRWQIDNPVDRESGVTTDPIPAGVRVKYNYRTKASATFTVVPEQRFDGESSPVQTERTAGPIDVAIDLETPKDIWQQDSGASEFHIPIEITNVGDGQVANLNQEYQDVQILDAGFAHAQNAEVDCQQSSVMLFEGTRRFTCNARVPSDVFQQQLTFELELAYSYFEQDETSFRVEGLDGDHSHQ